MFLTWCQRWSCENDVRVFICINISVISVRQTPHSHSDSHINTYHTHGIFSVTGFLFSIFIPIGMFCLSHITYANTSSGA